MLLRSPLFRLFLALLVTGAAAFADPVKFARYPHVSNDGRIAFSYHGDIWIAQPDGSKTRRLTAHIAHDTFPRFSPDGRWVAFNSDRMGNDDVWVVSASGGEPRQLTFHSTGDSIQYWTPDGTGVVIGTSRSAHPWSSPLFVVPLDGGWPEPLPMDSGAAGMIRQDGKVIAFNRRGFRYWRKHYRGNNNTDIWTQDLETKVIRQLTDLDVKAYRSHTQDAYPMWGGDGMIYFMSERDGIFNIWRIAPRGGEPEQVTRHAADGIQYPSISPDGRTIVYENEFDLWKLTVPGGTPERIALELSFDPKENRVHYLESENEADGFTPSPDTKFVAVDYHGEIFIVPTDDETGEKTQVTSSGWREHDEIWSPDGEWIAYISDQTHEEEIWLYEVATAERRQLTRQESTKGNLLWTPDSSKLLFGAQNKIWSVDVETGVLTELASNEEGGFRFSQITEDGRWLVYSRSDTSLNSDVYLYDLEQRVEHNVTDHLGRESTGYLTPDGKKVVFSSDRDGGETQLFVVSLTPLTEDPDDPLVKAKKGEKKERKKGEKEEKGEQDPEADEPGEQEKAEEAKEPALELTIDLTDIDRRARRLTSGERVGSFFLSADGKSVYFTRGGALHSIPVDGGEAKKVADGSFRRLRPTPDRKAIFFSEDGGVAWMSLARKKKETVKFAFRVEVDHRAEWEQVFEESWRVMKYRFYDEKMHGFDWDAIKARYKPLLPYVGENQDLYDLCNEMIGELNASHTGVSGPPTRQMESLYSTKHLGFELEAGGKRYRVSHVYRDGPADREWLDLSVGDSLISIEGTPVLVGDNYFPLLSHLLNDYVTLEVASPAVTDEAGNAAPLGLGESRTVRLRPVSSVRDLKYEEWVHQNRELVDEWSGGKIGYVHIRSMSRGPLARFEQEIDRYWDKNGMIIDIRFNGGGNIDQELIDILERRPFEYWNHRDGGRARGRRPRQCIAGPKVMLINWRSASDSEVTPQGFRDLELGRIVGNPTYGAVIATGSYRLLSGARIRTPGSLVTTYDPSQPFNYGLNLENYGVPPDVWVENTPEDELAGFDRELKASVDEALRMLAEGDWQYGEDD